MRLFSAVAAAVAVALTPPQTLAVRKHLELLREMGFGIEVFEPGTSNTLMAALLMHDLSTGSPTRGHPWQDEAYAAVHGGLWRAAYDPRSALGLAAILGFGSAR